MNESYLQTELEGEIARYERLADAASHERARLKEESDRVGLLEAGLTARRNELGVLEAKLRQEQMQMQMQMQANQQLHAKDATTTNWEDLKSEARASQMQHQSLRLTLTLTLPNPTSPSSQPEARVSRMQHQQLREAKAEIQELKTQLKEYTKAPNYPKNSEIEAALKEATEVITANQIELAASKRSIGEMEVALEDSENLVTVLAQSVTKLGGEKAMIAVANSLKKRETRGYCR